MTQGQLRRIASIWSSLDDGDLSTEQLFARTCDQASDELGVTVDESDVTEALQKFPAQP